MNQSNNSEIECQSHNDLILLEFSLKIQIKLIRIKYKKIIKIKSRKWPHDDALKFIFVIKNSISNYKVKGSKLYLYHRFDHIFFHTCTSLFT